MKKCNIGKMNIKYRVKLHKNCLFLIVILIYIQIQNIILKTNRLLCWHVILILACHSLF